MPWFKVHEELFTSPSHAELDGDALLTLIVLMSFVRSSCDAAGGWTPWATLPNGKPITARAIAVKARKPAQVVADALVALVDAGTVERREDGAFGLPGFREHQEGDSTARVQAHRTLRAEEEAPPIRLAGAPTEDDRRVALELEQVRQALTYGWADHAPPRPKGLPPLRLHLRGVTALLASGWSAATLLEAIDKVAELVEAGELPRGDWTSTKVFSGWIDTMLVAHHEWEAKKSKRVAAAATVEPDDGPVVSAEVIEQKTRGLLSRMGR